MPVARGGILGSLLLIGIAPVLIDRVTSAATPSWLIAAVPLVQGAAFIWMATAHPAASSLAFRYRILLASVAMLALAMATLWLGLPARSVGLAVGGLCHAAANVCLLTWFVASLRPGREPIITGFARRMRQTMPLTVVRYTRRVTIVWAAFFAAQLGVSAVLLIAAPDRVWSSFVNLWTMPLVAAMVLGEFACRWFAFRHEQRTGLVATLAGLTRIAGTPGHSP